MNTTPDATYWRKCTSCKKLIGFNQMYWICSVSTCNRIRTGLIFCSVTCFDAHIPILNHREAGAIEQSSPTQKQWEQQNQKISQTAPIRLSPPIQTTTARSLQPKQDPQDILVVISKVKEYIRNCSQMNTSGPVMEVLSERVRRYAQEGITRAKNAGRKTVLNRDF